MKTINHKGFELTAQFAKYQNGQVAIKLTDNSDGFPYATATVCVEDNLLNEGEVAIKNYSENEGILESLIEAEVIEVPHAFIQSSFTKIPICKLLKND
jgi:hypothetical protein